MNEPIAHSGLWALALIMIVLVSWVMYRYLAPRTRREWAGAGLVQAFIIALYAEMYGLFGEGVVHWPTVFSIGLFPLIVLAYVLLARFEERRMVTAFGENYRGYQRRVPMFWPRWGHWRQLVEGARMSREGEPSQALGRDARSNERPRVHTRPRSVHPAPTTTRGYTTPLYILPFDHRASFERGMFGWNGTLGVEQTARIIAAKRVIYDGFVAAVAGGVPKEHAGILVDEQFGAAILRDGSDSGYITSASVEKSGQEEFDFEFGDAYAPHIEAFAPTFAKVLVRYNPDGDAAMNRRQAARLRRLSEYLETSPSKYMFELLVPATPAELNALGGDTQAYDRTLRPSLMDRAIRELQDAGVEPDVWKIEGLDRWEDDARIVETVRRDGRRDVGIIVLGRGESEPHVRTWLATAATVPGFIGFAVGRTTFWEPLVALRDEKISREAAVAEVARRYRQWVDVFVQARGAASSSDIAPRTPSATVQPTGSTL